MYTPFWIGFTSQYRPYAHFGYWNLVSDPKPNNVYSFNSWKVITQKCRNYEAVLVPNLCENFLFLSRSNERLSRSNEKLSRSNEKLSRSNEKLSRSNEKVPRSNEKVSRSNEKVSRSNEKLSRSNEKLSRSNEILSRSNEKTISF